MPKDADVREARRMVERAEAACTQLIPKVEACLDKGKAPVLLDATYLAECFRVIVEMDGDYALAARAARAAAKAADFYAKRGRT